MEAQGTIKVWDNAGTLYAAAFAKQVDWGWRPEIEITSKAARTLGHMIAGLMVNMGARVKLRPFLGAGSEVGWVATLVGHDLKDNYTEALNIIDEGQQDEQLCTGETTDEAERAEVPAPASE